MIQSWIRYIIFTLPDRIYQILDLAPEKVFKNNKSEKDNNKLAIEATEFPQSEYGLKRPTRRFLIDLDWE